MEPNTPEVEGDALPVTGTLAEDRSRPRPAAFAFLAAAHGRGIVHRDVKPGNLWLEAPGDRVKIVDFGLASALEGDAHLTTPGAVLGTPAYMAPEQAGGPIDHRADLFSLGRVLYRMTTGRLPFGGNSTMELLRNIAVQPPRPPRELNPEIPAPLEQLLLRLLTKVREQRTASATETVEALHGVERSLASATTAPHGATPCPAVATVSLTPTAPAPFKGFIDVIVNDLVNPRRQEVRLNAPDVMPLKPGDRFAIEAEMDPPAYLYILWIDADGTVDPVYPWKPDHWEERPAEELPLRRLRRPEASDHWFTIRESAPGMETLVLLVRGTPLPPDVDLKAELGAAPSQALQTPRATAWFENGEVVRDEPGRASSAWDEEKIDDPVWGRRRSRSGRGWAGGSRTRGR